MRSQIYLTLTYLCLATVAVPGLLTLVGLVRSRDTAGVLLAVQLIGFLGVLVFGTLAVLHLQRERR